MSATGLLHRSIGSPQHQDCEVAPSGERCWLCAGELTRGQRTDDWVGASFTGQNRARIPTAEWVCEACVYLCSRTSPVPGRPPKEGKSVGGNWRNYSHVLDGRGYHNYSKAEKPDLLAWLRGGKSPPWFAAVADSGQKHVAPFARVNPGATGLVLFEETHVALPYPESPRWTMVDRMAELLTMGATKAELASGRLEARAWQLCGPRLRQFEEQFGTERGGSWFSLALWLAQRDEETVAARMAAEKEAKRAKAGRRAKGASADADGRGAARVPSSVPEEREPQRDEALGHPAEPDAQRDGEGEQPRRVGHDDREGAAARCPECAPLECCCLRRGLREVWSRASSWCSGSALCRLAPGSWRCHAVGARRSRPSTGARCTVSSSVVRRVGCRGATGAPSACRPSGGQNSR